MLDGSTRDTTRLFAGPTYYVLARVENKFLVEGLIKVRPLGMPCALASALHNDEIRRRNDRIFIGAPPRLGTACIQALSARTHVLIPTVVDSMLPTGSTTYHVLAINDLCDSLKQAQLETGYACDRQVGRHFCGSLCAWPAATRTARA
jgi:cellulose biosynthesis protein BcsQ